MSIMVDQSVIRQRDIVSAEIIKITTSPATIIMITITLIANVLLAIIDASGMSFYTGGTEGPQSLSSFGIVMFAPVYAFLFLSVNAAASEYRGGQLRMTLATIPNRISLVIGKLVAILTVVLISAIIVLAPFRLIIGISDGLGVGDLLLDLGRWLAAYLFMSIIAFGLAGLLRSSIASLGILIALPIVVATGILQWPAGIRLLPDQASLSLLGTPGYDVTELSPGIAFTVLLVWALVSIFIYWFSLVRRDG